MYDPLLRRFLNADENIQDPYNTQNYNKYGYVLNNPLMFNDPSGEFVWAAGFFLTYVAPVIWGAVVGTLISVGMYTIQSLVMNNWSWNGFANSLLMGAVTGGVSGGLGQVFSASGFWGTVGNSTLAGAGSGGVTALLTGQNFLEGVLKGAVIGGGVAVLSHSIKYFVNGNYKSHAFYASGAHGDYKYDPSISKEAMQQNINDVQNVLFPESDPISNYGVGQNTLGPGNSEGFLAFGEKSQNLLAYASPQNYLSGKTDILYSPLAAQHKDLLGYVMVHETGHAYLNMLGLAGSYITRNKWDESLSLSKKYNTTDHFAILKLENYYASKNNLDVLKMFGIDTETLSVEFINFTQGVQNEINTFYQKLFPVFNRVMK